MAGSAAGLAHGMAIDPVLYQLANGSQHHNLLAYMEFSRIHTSKANMLGSGPRFSVTDSSRPCGQREHW
jgi:hypothetical protein